MGRKEIFAGCCGGVGIAMTLMSPSHWILYPAMYILLLGAICALAWPKIAPLLWAYPIMQKLCPFFQRMTKPYCYLTVDELHRLSITSRSYIKKVDYWISPAFVRRDSRMPEYFSADTNQKEILSVENGCRLIGRELPDGDYIIEYTTSSGNFIQGLNVRNGINSIVISSEEGVVLYKSP